MGCLDANTVFAAFTTLNACVAAGTVVGAGSSSAVMLSATDGFGPNQWR